MCVCVCYSGCLDHVKSLRKEGSVIKWEAPFSLNLTDSDPDVVYCVEIYNISCGRELIGGDCNVMDTSYALGDHSEDGYLYEYIVTPRSNVEGAMNGSFQTLRRTCMYTCTCQGSTQTDLSGGFPGTKH